MDYKKISEKINVVVGLLCLPIIPVILILLPVMVIGTRYEMFKKATGSTMTIQEYIILRPEVRNNSN